MFRIAIALMMFVPVQHCTRKYVAPTPTTPPTWTWVKADKTECARMYRTHDNKWGVTFPNGSVLRFSIQDVAESTVEAAYCTSDNKNWGK